MAFEGKTFDSIDLADLEALVENQVAEQRTLEYKRELPQQWTADPTKEFLADVSSFANAGGGYILYGVQEAKDKKGVAEKLSGLSGVSADAEILRLESKIRTGVAPRIPGVRSKTIDLDDKRFILVLHVPRSWRGPHMVTFQETSRFYSRTSNGKYRLDVNEIRDAFVAADSATDRINEFRLERVSAVVSQQTPVRLPETATVLFHSIPLGSLSRGSGSVNLSGYAVDQALHNVTALYRSTDKRRPNFDGTVGTFSSRGTPASYLQVYRRGGIVEVADTLLLHSNGDVKLIDPPAFEKHVIVTATSIMEFQKLLGVQPPVALMLSMVRVGGYEMRANPLTGGGVPLDRDVLIVPEVLQESLDEIDKYAVARLLRPAFDMICNAAGHFGSPNYDNRGEWRHDFILWQ